MKKFLFAAVAAITILGGVTGCKKEEPNPLVGTSWSYSQTRPFAIYVLKFETSTTGIMASFENNETDESHFTYRYSAPNVTITNGSGSTLSGTVSGSTMRFAEMGPGGKDMVFTKKE